ncbi:MAG: ketoacyl-synthetase C-terminal extension domain-containing protein [Caldilineaceae bacterium]
MQHNEIPPHLHFNHPNPHIDWARSKIAVTVKGTPWPAGKKIAGVSSFGMGGTNAHIILEEAPAGLRLQREQTQREPVGKDKAALVVPYKSSSALHDLMQRYADLATKPDTETSLGDLCYTANTGRSHFAQRCAGR